MELRLDGKTALVTGASKGIGFAIAQAILANGGRVMITGRDQAGVERAVRALQHEDCGHLAVR